MARNANENTNAPAAEFVRDALGSIEACYDELASERGIYMQKCKSIRAKMADNYDTAGNRGVSKKLLRKIVRERELERKIFGLTEGLEEDERSEMDMLREKLGDFANTALGQAALAQAGNGAATQAGA